MGWDQSPLVCESPLTRRPTTAAGEQNVVDQLNVSAYPNPFKDKVTFVIESPVSGQATLEVYNIMGQKLQTVFHGYITAERSQVVEYKSPTASNSTLIYKLRVGTKQVTGKLINIGKQ